MSIYTGNDGEVTIHVSGDETTPEALIEGIDSAIALLMAARDFTATNLTLEHLTDTSGWTGATVPVRLCACGCGRPVTGRADSKYATAACRTRHHRAIRQEQGTR